MARSAGARLAGAAPELGTAERNLRKAATDILPSDTMLVDLTFDEQTILGMMKPKTRYNIKTAWRHGVQVRQGTYGDIALFYDLYGQTCRRNGIILHDRSFFDAMFTSHELSHEALDLTTDFELLIAQDGTFPLAAIFIVYASTQATYLFGASSTDRRNLMGTYALQWEAIRRAKARGCTTYDLFGIAPNDDPSTPDAWALPLQTGFGGNELHRMGCWDYPLEHEAYRRFTAQEMVSQGYHLSR
jgi:lipid II:glycine glycyltransferase (peptidoglycan interpeptide bridge formation enzyme)